ncbi:uncharacterized protein BDR25DRAFT_175405, partial [Lindgomyces ingoldianus]
ILSKQTFRTFSYAYQSTYKPLIYQPIVDSSHHPLHIIRKRIQGERSRSGLWWHVTVGNNSSKTKVVRSWLRRRLIVAFIEELKSRGFDRDGKFVDTKDNAPHREVFRELLERGQIPELKGSLKLHAQAPLVTAKFEDVKREAAKLVEALCLGLETE